MAFKIAVLKETRANERRVALVPVVADKLTKLGATLAAQTGAGDAVKLPDAAFKNVHFAANPQGLVSDADIVLAVQPPSLAAVDAMKEGAILISFIYAHKEIELVKKLRDKNITCFAMELVPRITRASVLEVLNEDYIRTARAKGLSNRVVLMRHALRNAAVPILTVIGLGIAILIGGAVVTESVFGLPGLGRLTVEAVLSRDFPTIQTVILLFSVVYVVINLLIDISYTLFDPRIRY